MASAPSVKLGNQHRPCLIEHLVFEAARTPRGWIAFHRQQIFGAPRNAVQRSAVLARSDFSIAVLACASARSP